MTILPHLLSVFLSVYIIIFSGRNRTQNILTEKKQPRKTTEMSPWTQVLCNQGLRTGVIRILSFSSLVCLSRLSLILQVRLSGHIVLYGFWVIEGGLSGGINLSSSIAVLKQEEFAVAASALQFL